jgi:ABC-2 type transport system ATP-binding protein
MDEASNCDRLALMHRGRVIALDTPEGLRGLLDSDRLIRLAAHDVLGVAEALDSFAGVSEAWLAGRGLNVMLRAGHGPGELEADLRERGFQVENLGRVRPSIEDVFVSLIEAEEARHQ